MAVSPADSPSLAFLLRRLDAASAGAPAPDVVATHFPSLDQLLGGGLRRGDVALLAGDAGSGKSALALAMAVRAARHGRTVSYLSAEATPERLLERVAAFEGRFPLEDLSRGRLDEAARQRATEVVNDLRDRLPTFGRIPVPSADAVAEELRRALDLELAVVDGLGALAPGTRPRAEELAAALASLKRLALELGVALLVTMSLDGTVRGRPDPRPTLDDLGALGAAREIPDLVLGLFREEMYEKYTVGIEGATELLVLKHRHGATGYVDLYFFKKWMRFEDVVER